MAKVTNEECRKKFRDALPSHLKSKIVVHRALSLGDRCLVDFHNKEDEDIFDCYEYCDYAGAENFDYCVDVCESELRSAITQSVMFDPETLSIKSATLTGTCLWFVSPKGDEMLSAIREWFGDIGCMIDTGWIHPHELAHLGYEVEEEYPAVCYYHPVASQPGKCRIPDVLSLLDKLGEKLREEFPEEW